MAAHRDEPMSCEGHHEHVGSTVRILLAGRRRAIALLANLTVIAASRRYRLPLLARVFRNRPLSLTSAVSRLIGELSSAKEKGDLAQLKSNPATSMAATIAEASVYERTSRMARAMSVLGGLPDQVVQEARPLSFAYRLVLECVTEEEHRQLLAFCSGRLNGDEQLRVSGWAVAARKTEIARLLADRARDTPEGASSSRVAWLEGWLEDHPPAAERRSSPRVAVFDYRHPDRDLASINLGDFVQTLAMLGNLARWSGHRLGGDAGLATLVDGLRDRVAPERRLASPSDSLELVAVQRDFNSGDDVAPGTWLVSYGWFMWPRIGGEFDFPFHPNLLPIFLSFHCNMPELLTEESVDYLRRHSPVGCRDWSTVRLLLDRGVPAFFSGCVTTTFGNLGRVNRSRDDAALPVALVEVDEHPVIGVEGDTRVVTQVDSDVLLRTFAENLDVTLQLMDSYRDSYRSVRTSRLHCYLPSRAMGVDVEFLPPNPEDIRFDGLLGLDDEAFSRMADGIGEKLGALMRWILEGVAPDAVYARWAELCAPDVAAAKFRSAA